MNTETYKFENLSNQSRAVRFALATGFIGITLSVTGPVGYLVALPLFSVYLVATGLTGWGPIKELFRHEKQGARKLSTTARVGYATLGTVLIAAALTSPIAPLGWMALLPLFAIYPVFSAITGVDPIDAWTNNGLIQEEEPVKAEPAEVHNFAEVLLDKISQRITVIHHNRAA